MNKGMYKRLQGLLLLLTVFVLISSFYFQYVVGLQPCPLCLMQRLSAFLFAIFCVVALCLTTLKWGKGVAVFQILFAAIGLFFASRQIWLQFFPEPQTTSCLPELDMLLRYFPWQDVAHALFWGVGNCGDLAWQWLGISMPGWSALYFLTMLCLSGLIYYLLDKELSHDQIRL